MFFHRNVAARRDATENPYWMSFSDMMSGILILFVVICLGFMQQLQNRNRNISDEVREKIEQMQSKSQRREMMLRKISDELHEKGIHVSVEGDGKILRIPDLTLKFRQSRYDIDDPLKEKMCVIGRTIKKHLDDNIEIFDTIFIEGHSDGAQFARHVEKWYMKNWELSTLRAISLWELWTKDDTYRIDGMEDMKNADNKNLFSVSGYGDTRRIREREIDDADYEKNRRIDILFVTHGVTEAELEDIRKMLTGEGS